MGKKGTAGRPAPSWIPNLRKAGKYDPRPNRNIRQEQPETFQHLIPELGSRVFISGLPKDATSQDLEDLMNSQVGPTLEAYIVYQYGGEPLYRPSSTTSVGFERNPEAEAAHNIRLVVSTGCGLVHFQREKDALEAWEMFHGKLLENNAVLRVQVVVDADESWLPANDTAAMDVEDPAQHPAHPAHPVHPAPEYEDRRHDARDRPTFSTTATAPAAMRNEESLSATRSSNRPKLPSQPLLTRIASSDNTGLLSSQSGGPINLGGHTISASGLNRNLNYATPISGSPNVIPRGKAKKGPRRLAKQSVRTLQQHYSPSPVAINGVDHPVYSRPTAAQLDAEMEVYRSSGLMGLGIAGR